MKPFDADGAFRPAPDGLRRLALRGAAATLLSSGSGLTIQVVATLVLARLLTPADFGLVTMATTFSMLLANFGSNGFPAAIIQRKELDYALASNIFWINLGTSLLFTVGFAAAGSLLAQFYGNPRVEYVAVGVSLTIFLNSTWVIHTAILQRAMRFSVISANDVIARAVSVATSVLLAWQGWGYWALVGGAIALPLSTSIGAWSLCRWVPSLPRRVAGTGAMVRYAINVYGQWTVNYCARNTDNFLIGWRFNAQALGFYKKAYDLFALSANQLIAPLTVVAVSALSRLDQDSIQYKKYLLNAMAILAFVGMGLGADLTLVGNDVIRLLLGPGWEPSGRLFAFFGPGIGIMLLYGTHGWIHLSIARADRWFRWGIVEFMLTGLLFLLALRWGPEGIAGAWTASVWILAIPALWYAGKPIRLGITPVIAAVWKYAVASLLAGCTSAVIVREFPSLIAAPGSLGAVVRIVTISGLFGTLYLGAVILLHKGCAPLYQFGGLLREMIPWSRFSKPSPAISASCTGAGEAITLTSGNE